MSEKQTHTRYDFPCLWLGCCVSCFGNALYSAAIGIWVYQQTGSEAWMGIISATSFFVSFFVEPIAGAISDCLQARNLLVAADCLQSIVMLLIAALSYQQVLTVEGVFALSLLAAICNAIFSPASSVVLLQIVPAARLSISQSRLRASRGIITLCASACSATLVLYWGIPTLIAINGLTFLLSAISEVFITAVPAAQKIAQPSLVQVAQALKEGVCYLSQEHALRLLVFIFFLLNLCSAGFDGVLFAWYTNKGFSFVQYGLFLGSQSAASLFGALIFSMIPVEHLKKKVPLILLLSAQYLLYLGALYATNLFLSIGLFFLFCFGSVALEILLQLMVFEVIAPIHRGTILGILSALLSLGTGLSMVVSGVCSSFWNVQAVCMVGGALLLIPYLLFGYCVLMLNASNQTPLAPHN